MPTNSMNPSDHSVNSIDIGTHIVTSASCYTPPPSYRNINLPLGHPSTLTNERGAPPSYEEAIDPNGIYIYISLIVYGQTIILTNPNQNNGNNRNVIRMIVRSNAHPL